MAITQNIRRKLAALVVAAGTSVGVLGLAPSAAHATSGPVPLGCWSAYAGFQHRSGAGYWAYSTLACNRWHWVSTITKRNGVQIDRTESGWQSANVARYFTGGAFNCVHLGYQVVNIVYFYNAATGQSYQAGYFTSDAPRYLC